MYCFELIKFDVSNTSYYVEVENGALLRDVVHHHHRVVLTDRCAAP